MARFRFPLEGLLKVRRAAEQREQCIVADLERQRLALEDRLRRLQQTVTVERKMLRASLRGTLDAQLLRLQAASTKRHADQGRRLTHDLADVRERLAMARHTLAGAARARRAIELLRERRHEQWRRGLDRIETAALDELAGAAAARAQEHQMQQLHGCRQQ